MKQIHILLLGCMALFMLTAMTCDDYYDYPEMPVEPVTFVNDSDEPVYIYHRSWNKDTISCYDIFEDVKYYLDTIQPTMSKEVCVYSPWEDGFSLQILVLGQKLMSTHSKKEVIENNMYDKLFILNSADLESCAMIVRYSGPDKNPEP